MALWYNVLMIATGIFFILLIFSPPLAVIYGILGVLWFLINSTE